MEQWHVWTEAETRACIAVPSDLDDKYSRGVLGVIAGSKPYPGAAVMVSGAAMHTGVGMIRYLGPKKAQKILLTHRPEVVTQDGQVQAWTIGSGLDASHIGWQRTRTIKTKIGQGKPTVVDAGGLSLLKGMRGPILITPHFRELAGLLNTTGISVSTAQIRENPKKWAHVAADSLHLTILLKGHISYVVSQDREIALPPASPWLATAGTGDVLAGILGALVATNSKKITEQPGFLSAIAASGAFIHARAALLASDGGPITAMGVARAIPQAISDLLHNGL